MSDDTADECRDRNLDAIALIRACLDSDAPDHEEKVDAILSTLDPNQMFDVLYALATLGAIMVESWRTSLVNAGVDDGQLPSPDDLLNGMVQVVLAT